MDEEEEVEVDDTDGEGWNKDRPEAIDEAEGVDVFIVFVVLVVVDCEGSKEGVPGRDVGGVLPEKLFPLCFLSSTSDALIALSNNGSPVRSISLKGLDTDVVDECPSDLPSSNR